MECNFLLQPRSHTRVRSSWLDSIVEHDFKMSMLTPVFTFTPDFMTAEDIFNSLEKIPLNIMVLVDALTSFETLLVVSGEINLSVLASDSGPMMKSPTMGIFCTEYIEPNDDSRLRKKNAKNFFDDYSRFVWDVLNPLLPMVAQVMNNFDCSVSFYFFCPYPW